MKNCGSGEVERDGMGVEVAVDETERRPALLAAGSL